jgi:hypothetical protein
LLQALDEATHIARTVGDKTCLAECNRFVPSPLARFKLKTNTFALI